MFKQSVVRTVDLIIYYYGPCEQTFLSCMAFLKLAFTKSFASLFSQSRSGFVLGQLREWQAMRTTT